MFKITVSDGLNTEVINCDSYILTSINNREGSSSLDFNSDLSLHLQAYYLTPYLSSLNGLLSVFNN